VSVRLRDICDKLCADDQLRRCVWTTFEECLVNHVELMKDRHLDQFVMCAVYSICKVGKPFFIRLHCSEKLRVNEVLILERTTAITRFALSS